MVADRMHWWSVEPGEWALHRIGYEIVESRRARLHGRGLATPARAEGPKQNEHDELEVAGKHVAVVVVVVVVVECVSGPGGMVFGELQ